MKGLGRVVVGSAVGGLLGAASFFAVEAFADPGSLKQKWLDAGMEYIANPTATEQEQQPIFSRKALMNQAKVAGARTKY